jgi:hypothetical protein
LTTPVKRKLTLRKPVVARAFLRAKNSVSGRTQAFTRV